VTPDGKRFVMLRPAATEAASETQLIIVQNFFEELTRLVPMK
jgi:hypothetical protein